MESVTLGTSGEILLPRHAKHFDMCQFTAEDEEFKSFCRFAVKIATTTSLDGLRQYYVGILRAFHTGLGIGFPKASRQPSAPHHIFLRVVEAEPYKTWRDSAIPALLYLRYPWTIQEPTLARLVSSSICQNLVSLHKTVVYFSFRPEHEMEDGCSEGCKSIIRQILAMNPDLLTYLYDNYEESLGDFVEDRYRDDQQCLFGLLRAILCCPLSKNFTCIIDSVQNAFVGARELIEGICEAMKAADSSFRVIVCGNVATANSSNDTDFPYVVGEVFLEDYILDVQHHQHNIDDVLDIFIGNSPSVQEFQDDLASQLLGFPYKSLEDLHFEVRCLQTSHTQSTPSALRQEAGRWSRRVPDVLFERIMSTLDGPSQKWAADVFMWIAYSFEPLRVEQLNVALSLFEAGEMAESSKEHLARDLEADLTYSLGPLVIVERGIVKFAHPTIAEKAREYAKTLLPTGNADFSIHRKITHLCLGYLSTNRLRDLSAVMLNPTENQYYGPPSNLEFWKDHGFTLYASENWAKHYRAIKRETEDDVKRVVSHLTDEEWLFVWQCVDMQFWKPNLPLPTRFEIPSSAELVAASLGLKEVLKAVLTPNFQKRINPPQSYSNLIEIASTTGEIPMLEYLVFEQNICEASLRPVAIAAALFYTKGAATTKILTDLVACGEYAASPGVLEPLAYAGQIEILTQILQTQKDLAKWQEDISNALATAIRSRNGELVDLLLLYSPFLKKKLETSNEDASFLLQIAVIYGDTTILDTVIKRVPHLNFHNDSRLSALHWACLLGCDDKLCRILEVAGVDMDVKTPAGRTPLHFAALYGRSKMVDVLIKKGATIDAVDEKGDTPLGLAVRCQYSEIVEKLLCSRANIAHSNKHGDKPVHIAASLQALHIIKILNQYGADLECENVKGLTPLHLAVQAGALDIVTYLMNEWHCDVKKADRDGKTPLIIAASEGHLAICRYLLDHGSIVEEEDISGMTSLHHVAVSGRFEIIQLLLDRDANLSKLDRSKRTALHYAAEEGNLHITECLLAHGANALLRDLLDKSALDCAIGHDRVFTASAIIRLGASEAFEDIGAFTRLLRNAVKCSLETVELAVQHGGDLNSRDEGGHSTLYNSLSAGQGAIAKFVLEHGFELDEDSEETWEMLRLAIENFSAIDLLELLRRHGANLDQKSRNGTGTPLHIAAQSGTLEQVRYLLQNGCAVDARNRRNATPLYFAVNRDKIAKELLDHNSDPSAQGGLWGSVLSAAVVKCKVYTEDDLDIFNQLLSHGAQVEDKDAQGRTPIHLAAGYGALQLLKFLLGKCESGLLLSDKQGRLPIHFAAAYAAAPLGLKVIDFMLRDSAGDEAQLARVPDADGWTPLHWACRSYKSGMLSTIERLIQRGADPSATDCLGWRPEHIAIFHNNATKEIKMLLSVTPDRKVKDDGEPLRTEMPNNGKNNKDNQEDSQEKLTPAGELAGEIFVNGLPVRAAPKCTKEDICDGCFGVSRTRSFPQNETVTDLTTKDIYGPRYHCRTCLDFDFCYKCAWTRNITHPVHEFEIFDPMPELFRREETGIIDDTPRYEREEEANKDH